MDSVVYLFGWFRAWKFFICLSSGSVDVSCMYHRKNKMEEAETGSGHDKARDIQDTNLHEYRERDCQGCDLLLCKLSSRMYLGLQDDRYRHYTNTSIQVQNKLRNLPSNRCSQ